MENLTTAPLIELNKVGVRFGDYTVHEDISLGVSSGEVITLMGPSGTGKTVILKLIIGLLRPSWGEVRVLGHKISELPEARIRPIRRNIGMLFQGAALFDSLTVFENVAYSLREFGEHSEADIQHMVEEKLAIVGLPDIAMKFPPELSGGQKKRVGLARALASSPKVVLFDEPTTGLDPTAIRMIDELIVKLKREYGITSIVVTHDIESARRFSDRWVLLSGGHVVAQGNVRELEQHSEEVRNFVSGKWKEDA